MIVRRRLLVTGRVQGVGFRYQTFIIAERLRLTGWVRNNSDGTVTIEVQGDKHQVVAFIEEISKPQRFIDVESVQESELNPIFESSYRIVG